MCVVCVSGVCVSSCECVWERVCVSESSVCVCVSGVCMCEWVWVYVCVFICMFSPTVWYSGHSFRVRNAAPNSGHSTAPYRSTCCTFLTQQDNKILPTIFKVSGPLYCLLCVGHTVLFNFSLDEPWPSSPQQCDATQLTHVMFGKAGSLPAFVSPYNERPSKLMIAPDYLSAAGSRLKKTRQKLSSHDWRLTFFLRSSEILGAARPSSW
jgi:hypothetical protein